VKCIEKDFDKVMHVPTHQLLSVETIDAGTDILVQNVFNICSRFNTEIIWRYLNFSSFSY